VSTAPLVIEDVDDAGTQWLLSFDGPNPTEDMVVRCVDRAEAFKLKNLIETIGAVDTIVVFPAAS
jgi:hypothetical protein